MTYVIKAMGAVSLVALALPVLALNTSAGAATPPTNQWPEFHGSAALTGTSAMATISTDDAPQLGVRWMAPVGPSQGSPMVAWNATLGETVVYDGVEGGYLNALKESTGSLIWSDSFGKPVISSPLVEGNSVWIAPAGSLRVYKVNSATGAVECSAAVNHSVLSTPVIATPPGGQTTVYFATLGAGTNDGAVYAFAEATCATTFTWGGFTTPGQTTGVWSPLSYSVDASGEPLLVFGSANPDSSVYALDAVTGKLVWTYDTDDPGPQDDWDVGAGVNLSAPGHNGFADGVAYVVCKSGMFYALDLTTGALLWNFDFGTYGAKSGVDGTDAVSTPALSGTTVVFGDDVGLFALDVATEKLLWMVDLSGNENSSPAIIGPAGQQVIAFGMLNDYVQLMSLATGASLYTFKTTSYITSSPAIVDGNILLNSFGGYLYDFALGGANGTPPTTGLTAPASGATVPYPSGGKVIIHGTATAPDGVASVKVQVQENGAAGPWLGAGGIYGTGMSINNAIMATPGATTTDWTMAVPVPPQGASYSMQANAVDTDGLADPTSDATSSFTVSADASAPVVTASAARVAPGGTLDLSASGFTPNESVKFTISGFESARALGTATASSKGTITNKAVTVAKIEPFGVQEITAEGSKSRASGAVDVTVSNDWTQYGDGPERTGFEANDTTLVHYQAVSSQTFLTQAWSFATTSGVDTSPVVVSGVEYVGDESGDLFAVTVATGTMAWEAKVGSGIEATPAVDGGNVYVGDDAGNVVQLATAGGASGWSTSLGSTGVSSIDVAGGVVYAASTTGVIAALNETTGAVEWTVSVNAAVTAPISVDTINHNVIVPDQTGTVTALNTGTGKKDWSVAAGTSPLTTAAAISSTTVFVGSSNGTLYALSVHGGTLLWSEDLGGSITATPALVATSVAVGDADGTVTYLAQSTGHTNGSQSIGAPITGIATASGITVLSTTEGLALTRGVSGVRVAWSVADSAGFPSGPVLLNGEVFAVDAGGICTLDTIPGATIT
jgi:outer membrane protein assembly factor BamB